jgi:hypothetical protein
MAVGSQEPKSSKGPVTNHHNTNQDDSVQVKRTCLPKNTSGEVPNAKRCIRDGIVEISLTCLIICVPILLLSGLLLGLTLHYRVDTSNQSTSPTFLLPSPLEYPDSAYYVNFSATQLVTIASWSSSLAPLLSTLAMVLVSYLVARSILRSSQAHTGSLPTPFQLNLLLSAISASLGSFWSFARYFRVKKGTHIASVVKMVYVAFLSFTFIGLVLAHC